MRRTARRGPAGLRKGNALLYRSITTRGIMGQMLPAERGVTAIGPALGIAMDGYNPRPRPSLALSRMKQMEKGPPVRGASHAGR